jgi:hypothetical protein
MTGRVWLLLLALCVWHAAGAVELSRSGTDAATEAVATLEHRLVQGLQQRDRSVLEPLIATRFTWIHASDGRVDDRETWLANAARGTALSGQRTQRSEHGVSIQWFGDGTPHTAIRLARVQLVDPAQGRESWLRQTHVLVRESDGAWRLVLGQGVLMYEGGLLDPALHRRYVGTYDISTDRRLILSWEEGALFATFPTGARSQVFLASPTEEASRTAGAGRLTFSLDADGRPESVALVRGSQEVWRARRSSQE